jgi:hypothetical protein
MGRALLCIVHLGTISTGRFPDVGWPSLKEGLQHAHIRGHLHGFPVAHSAHAERSMGSLVVSIPAGLCVCSRAMLWVLAYLESKKVLAVLVALNATTVTGLIGYVAFSEWTAKTPVAAIGLASPADLNGFGQSAAPRAERLHRP